MNKSNYYTLLNLRAILTCAYNEIFDVRRGDVSGSHYCTELELVGEHNGTRALLQQQTAFEEGDAACHQMSRDYRHFTRKRQKRHTLSADVDISTIVALDLGLGRRVIGDSSTMVPPPEGRCADCKS
jgi:hypothetical protein